MENKAIQLLGKVEELKNDMVKYIKEYILYNLKNEHLLHYQVFIPFYNADIEETLQCQLHSVDEDGDLFLVFDYEDGRKAEDVEIDNLTFEALCYLIGFYHDRFE